VNKLVSLVARAKSAQKAAFLILAAMSVFLLAGCEPVERFKVPEHLKKDSQKVVLYQVKNISKLPRIRLVWKDMTQRRVGLLRPEMVSLQGQTWSREGQAKLYEFYFRRNNYLRAYDIMTYADSIPAFLSKLAARPFSQRINVLLAPFPPLKAGQKAPKLPILPGKTIVLYTGTNTTPAWTRAGLIRRLVQRTAQVLLTGETKDNRDKLWTSLVLPSYIAFRGKAVMADRSYNRTAKPRYTALLKKSGYPTALELKRALLRVRNVPTLPNEVREHWLELATSLLAFVEDAYGQRALFGAIQLHLKSKRKDHDFLRSVQDVLGVAPDKLWKQWETYYHPLRWKQTTSR
jgi:hypothetical protein